MAKTRYDEDAHRALTARRVDLPIEQVFTQRDTHGALNPFGVKMRESRDSDVHPESLAIILGLDETGSMGDLPHDLATCTLPTFIGTLIEEGTVPYPQVMIMAYGDALNNERSPLQVGQFEAAADKIDQDLTRVHLERKGGSNRGESSDLPIYFAARHTSIDCFEKRGRRGYLALTGDEPGFEQVSAAAVRHYLGDDLDRDIPIKDIIDECAKRYHIFFLIPDLHRRTQCEAWWRKKLGDNVICMESHKDTSLVMAALIGLTEGAYEDLDALQASLQKRKVDARQAARVLRAVTPYAASIGRGDARKPSEDADPPTGQGTSRRKRIS